MGVAQTNFGSKVVRKGSRKEVVTIEHTVVEIVE
jgi:hypothetical protein